MLARRHSAQMDPLQCIYPPSLRELYLTRTDQGADGAAISRDLVVPPIAVGGCSPVTWPETVGCDSQDRKVIFPSGRSRIQVNWLNRSMFGDRNT